MRVQIEEPFTVRLDYVEGLNRLIGIVIITQEHKWGCI